ncbi:MAG: hypothetical protein ACI814_005161 [Mariniblastus sp.]|jgi:hypothetical protein
MSEGDSGRRCGSKETDQLLSFPIHELTKSWRLQRAQIIFLTPFEASQLRPDRRPRCRSVNQGWMRGGYVGILFILPSVRRQEQCVML